MCEASGISISPGTRKMHKSLSSGILQLLSAVLSRMSRNLYEQRAEEHKIEKIALSFGSLSFSSKKNNDIKEKSAF
jgi:hypothetical protein